MLSAGRDKFDGYTLSRQIHETPAASKARLRQGRLRDVGRHQGPV